MKSFVCPYVVFVFIIFLNHCVGDLYFDTVNEMNDSKIPRSEALRQFYATVLLKRSLCPKASDLIISTVAYNTTKKGAGCQGPNTNKESEKTLRSCESMHLYVEKKNLTVCLNEVLFIPCEPLEISRTTIGTQLNFPVCRGLFGPGGASETTL